LISSKEDLNELQEDDEKDEEAHKIAPLRTSGRRKRRLEIFTPLKKVKVTKNLHSNVRNFILLLI